jgi:erythritol/L-threitol dehydrogenase
MDLTDGYGADVYVEGTGHHSAMLQSLNLLRKIGTFVQYGVFGSDVSVDWSIISDDKELNVLGRTSGPDCWLAAIRMIESPECCRWTRSALTIYRSQSSRRG